MANTLGGVNLAQIAEETLATLLQEFVPVGAFTTDFNSDIAQKGASVATRIVTAVDAMDLSSGYGTDDTTVTTAKTITLDTFYGHVMSFTDAEVSKAGDLNWLREMFIAPAVEATVEKVMDDLLALVTTTNFSSAIGPIAVGSFDADDLADAAGTMTTAKVPKRGRFFMLNPSFHSALAKDAAVQAAYAYGSSEVIRDNRIPRVHGFDIYEYGDIPTNNQFLVGIGGNRQGLLIAARQPATPSDPGLEVVNVSDSVTGLPLQFRRWYDPTLGAYKMSVGLLYGVAVGNAAALYRLVRL